MCRQFFGRIDGQGEHQIPLRIPSMHQLSVSCQADSHRAFEPGRCVQCLPGLLCLAAFLVMQMSPAIASDRLNWPVRTGPTLDGHVAAGDSVGLPTEWSEVPEKNIAWKLDLEGFGHSVPVIGHGRVWLTSATRDGKQQFVYCIDQSTGKILHHKLMYENPEPEPLMNEVNTYASPSCALEDDAVYVHFGTYGTARLNPETLDVVWDRRDIRCRHYRGPGSSPILWKDLLVLTFDGIDVQFLMALNKRTGETVWRTDRTTNYGDLDENGQPQREGDLRKAYSTPGVVEINGKAQIVSVGSRAAFAYDALTGKELWTIRHDDFNASSPPAFLENHAILNTGSRGSNLLSIRLDDTTRGDVSASHVIWNRDKGNSDLSAPILIGDRIFSVLNNGVLNCVDARTGNEIWKDRIEGTFTASPITANGVIYFCNEEGVSFVVRAGEKFELVGKNTLAEGMRASPSAADGRLFLRTFTRLYAIGM
jgi:outer membrane protein assembly factor BamB